MKIKSYHLTDSSQYYKYIQNGKYKYMSYDILYKHVSDEINNYPIFNEQHISLFTFNEKQSVIVIYVSITYYKTWINKTQTDTMAYLYTYDSDLDSLLNRLIKLDVFK